MELNDVIFTNNLPKLDLHGFDRETARVTINDFIKDNKKLKNEIVVIIHGIGSGILKKTTQETLKNNRDVIDQKIDFYNVGTTLVKISVDK